MKIINVKRITVEKKYGYDYLKGIVVKRADQKEHMFVEANFSRLNQNDIEDLCLFKIQDKIHKIDGIDKFDFINALQLYIRRIVIKKRVEDAQLGIESNQTKLNLTKPQFMAGYLHQKVSYTTLSHPIGVVYLGNDNQNMKIRADEIHKFSDGTLNKIHGKLEVMLKEKKLGFGHECMIDLCDLQSLLDRGGKIDPYLGGAARLCAYSHGGSHTLLSPPPLLWLSYGSLFVIDHARLNSLVSWRGSTTTLVFAAMARRVLFVDAFLMLMMPCICLSLLWRVNLKVMVVCHLRFYWHMFGKTDRGKKEDANSHLAWLMNTNIKQHIHSMRVASAHICLSLICLLQECSSYRCWLGMKLRDKLQQVPIYEYWLPSLDYSFADGGSSDCKPSQSFLATMKEYTGEAPQTVSARPRCCHKQEAEEVSFLMRPPRMTNVGAAHVSQQVSCKEAELSGKGVTTIIGGGDSMATVEEVVVADVMSDISTSSDTIRWDYISNCCLTLYVFMT
nr:phosphoglycerate kinase [Tanacetum cinerariifolium]